MKYRLLLAMILALVASNAFAGTKPAQVCKITFQVVYLDRLNNTNMGIPPQEPERCRRPDEQAWRRLLGR